MSFQYQFAAWSDAAGRERNEDRFIVCQNLSTEEWYLTDKTVIPDALGCLLCVCDGMGGMNAGDVASETAIESVHGMYKPIRLLKADATAHPEAYIRKTIEKADMQIREEAATDESCSGMGSTIVLAWMFGDKAYIGWCGDSRAYHFNQATGLQRLTHDHSYVQQLVDSGKLDLDNAFSHPDNNIITRSLGNVGDKAIPESTSIRLSDGDVLLLCSDGLCGIMQDSEIEDVIAHNQDDMYACRDKLLSESGKLGWTDNITIVLCQIAALGDVVPKNASGSSKKLIVSSHANFVKIASNRRNMLMMVLSILCVLAIFIAGYFFIPDSKMPKEQYIHTDFPNTMPSVNHSTASDTVIKDPLVPIPDEYSSDSLLK
jgi:protein phosphatase